MNLVIFKTHTLYFSISLIPNGKLLRVVAKRMSKVSLNISKHLAIFNYVKIVLFLREIISMTLEGKEMVFTRITWGELEGANSEFKCNTFAKPCYSSFLSFFLSKVICYILCLLKYRLILEKYVNEDPSKTAI